MTSGLVRRDTEASRISSPGSCHSSGHNDTGDNRTTHGSISTNHDSILHFMAALESLSTLLASHKTEFPSSLDTLLGHQRSNSDASVNNTSSARSSIESRVESRTPKRLWKGDWSLGDWGSTTTAVLTTFIQTYRNLDPNLAAFEIRWSSTTEEASYRFVLLDS